MSYILDSGSASNNPTLRLVVADLPESTLTSWMEKEILDKILSLKKKTHIQYVNDCVCFWPQWHPDGEVIDREA